MKRPMKTIRTTTTCEAITTAQFDIADMVVALAKMCTRIQDDEDLAPIFKGECVEVSLKTYDLDDVPASHDTETDDARVLCELRLPAHVSELHGEGLDAASMVLSPAWWGEQTLPVRHDGDLPTAKLSGPIAVSLKDCDVQCLGTLFDRDAEVIVRIKDESDGEGDE